MRLYDSRMSGNSWKVRILLNQLGQPYDRITLDLAKGETHTPEFQRLNRFSRVPVLQLDDGRTIVESGAILLYLAQGSRYLPDDPWLRAQVTGWLSFEQGDLQKPLALCRVYHLKGLAEQMAPQIEQMHNEGYPALAKLDQWLSGHDWLVGDDYTVADLGVFAYVSLATAGGFDMRPFTAIEQWIARVKNQPGWIDLLPVE
ncbi:glutathione S-transferase family protein [Pseudomonas sp. REP124]|uniref:glutathione S-transferase family protein n=1 Tax=Pseudomonas sp. REP124 TaxID=2875731 RepID=UPI001CCA6358|nr:glutathione S-transferase family protein [Pseudomonas sp. REP124]MBZ9780330.1 glutathione S-transferase family protein [Pseudomonas sp. REP124]